MNENNINNHSKSRVMTLLAIAAVAVGALLFVWRHVENKKNAEASVAVTTAPKINSVPGAGNPSSQYVQDQNLQNQINEQNARKHGTSAVPTITRSNFVGDPGEFSNDELNTGSTAPGQCPLKKVVVMFKPNPASCTVENLKMARKTGVTAEELACQACSCPALKLAGYTSGDLKEVGYTASQLKNCGFTIDQLVAAGFNARDLKQAGFTAVDLAKAGFTAGEIQQAFNGVPLQHNLSAATLAQNGLDAAALKKAGFSAAQLKAAGFSDEALKAAGYSPSELAQAANIAKGSAGLSAAELKAHGFTANQLKNMGFTAKQLKAAGFTDNDLKNAGFSDREIQDANRALQGSSLENNGLAASQLKGNGLNAAALKKQGFTAAQLKAAGFTDHDLKNAGFTQKEIDEVSKISPGSKGLSASDLRSHGLSASQLKNMGFTAADLKAAGFTADQLKKAGFNANDLRKAGFSAADLKAAGFTPAELKNAGFTAGQLKAAGFTPEELKSAGFTSKDLRDAGVTAAQLHDAGYSAPELRSAGFTRGDLLRGGYTPAEAGYAQNTGNTGVNANTMPSPARIAANTAAGTTPALNNFAQNNSGNNGSTDGSSIPSMTANSPEARLAEVARLQQKQMNAQQRQDYIVQQQGAMTMQAQKLLEGWSNHSNQTLAKAPEDKTATNNGAGTSGAAAAAAPIIKAGTVLFAVLDTGVNSDNNSPIMAHVVSGTLKGAKLLGKFERVNDRVLLSFYLVSTPRYPSSIGINAVGIDPDTAHTAMADSVDHHYLLRYGTLFASAFLQGLSNAVIANHSTMFCGNGLFGPSCQQMQTTGLDTKGQAAVAMGTVGQQFSNHLGNVFDTPPTIKISAGSGLGVLFMSDVQMPTQAMAPTQTAVKNQLLALTQGN